MFRLFKKKRKLDPMTDQLNLAIEDLGEKWINFTKTTRFKGSDPISENIDIFAQPLVQYFKERYMTLYQFSGGMFWYTVSMAIVKSKTFPKFEVDLAIRELDAK